MAILRNGNPDRLCVHHSAVVPGADNLDDLKRRLAQYETTHAKKSWAEETKTGGEYGYSCLAYHIAIAKDGHEIRTQDDKYVLYHAGDNARGKDSFNLHGIGVLLDGNYETEIPTSHQKEALARIIARFERKYKVNVLVRGHKETSLTGTACPGKNIGTHDQGFMKEAIERANEIIKNNETDNPLNSPEESNQDQIENGGAEIENYSQKNHQILTEIAPQIGEIHDFIPKWQKELETAKKNLEKIAEEKDKIDAERKDFQRRYKNKLDVALQNASLGQILIELWHRITTKKGATP